MEKEKLKKEYSQGTKYYQKVLSFFKKIRNK